MEKGIDIHNYDRLLAKTMVRMKSSGISEKNKNVIEKFGDHCFANGIGSKVVLSHIVIFFMIISFKTL